MKSLKSCALIVVSLFVCFGIVQSALAVPTVDVATGATAKWMDDVIKHREDSLPAPWSSGYVYSDVQVDNWGGNGYIFSDGSETHANMVTCQQTCETELMSCEEALQAACEACWNACEEGDDECYQICEQQCNEGAEQAGSCGNDYGVCMATCDERYGEGEGEEPFEGAGPYFMGALASGDTAGNIAVNADAHSEEEGQKISAHSDVLWSYNDTNETGVSQDYTMDFFIPEGYLEVGAFLAGDSGAGYFIDIQVNGQSVWSSALYLSYSTTGGVALADSVNGIPNLLSGELEWEEDVEFEAGWARYTTEGYNGSIDLGTFAAGETLEIDYLMTSWVDVEGYGNGNSSFGDPCGVGVLVAQQPTATDPVPEPSTVLLLASGVLGLIAMGRKKFRK